MKICEIIFKLLNNLLERGYNQKKLDVFKEAELKLMEMKKEMTNDKNMSYRLSLEETLESIEPVIRQITKNT